MPNSQDNPTLISLSSMSVGQQGLIVAFSFTTEECERTQSFGLIPGEILELVRRQPQGDVEINIRGYFRSLTRDEADHIKIKPLAPKK